MPDTTVTQQPGWEITEHQRDDGGTTLVARIDGQPSWCADELVEPIGGYRWQIYAADGRHFSRAALVWDAEGARSWLEHEAAHALLAAKVVAA